MLVQIIETYVCDSKIQDFATNVCELRLDQKIYAINYCDFTSFFD